MRDTEAIQSLAIEFEDCQKILSALGDEVRQYLIVQMMYHGKDCNGMRVPEITKLTHLSRSAVSHHLQILKDAGIVRMRREGTMNYYYFADDNSIEKLIAALQHANAIIKALPDRSGESDG